MMNRARRKFQRWPLSLVSADVNPSEDDMVKHYAGEREWMIIPSLSTVLQIFDEIHLDRKPYGVHTLCDVYSVFIPGINQVWTRMPESR
ncbi:hypothetical protein R1flu_027530 [Riccia fluitans]|uniref:Uncharacterized protein n=1 Tax=Riccia fluitans TaxID=41844 RepID=A0ABD1XJ40_9MARC